MEKNGLNLSGLQEKKTSKMPDFNLLLAPFR